MYLQAAAAHEVGHALGLMHPDQALASGTNLRWNGTGDGASPAPCDDPWSAVVAAPRNSSVAPSIMLAFTQFNKGVCLSQATRIESEGRLWEDGQTDAPAFCLPTYTHTCLAVTYLPAILPAYLPAY